VRLRLAEVTVGRPLLNIRSVEETFVNRRKIVSSGHETMKTVNQMDEKQWWEHRVPVVDFKCSCSECKPNYDGSTDPSGVETFFRKCKKFGELRGPSHFELGEHPSYLKNYRKQILEPMLRSYSGIRKTEDGRNQVLLIGHRHSFHDLGRERNKPPLKDVQEKVIREERHHRSIPIFPYWVDPGATIELHEHALEALGLVVNAHGSGQPIELHVQLGSGIAAAGALLHALYHYSIMIDAKVHIFTYFVDLNYDNEKTKTGHDAKLHQMPLARLDEVVRF